MLLFFFFFVWNFFFFFFFIDLVFIFYNNCIVVDAFRFRCLMTPLQNSFVGLHCWLHAWEIQTSTWQARFVNLISIVFFYSCLPAYHVSFFFVFLLFSVGMLLQSIYQPCFHCELPVCPTVQRVGAKLSLTAPALLSHLLRMSTGNLISIKGAELWHQIESWIHVGVQVSSVCNQFSSYVSNPSHFIILALGSDVWITDGRGWWKNWPWPGVFSALGEFVGLARGGTKHISEHIGFIYECGTPGMLLWLLTVFY